MSEVFPRIFNLRFENRYRIIDFGKLNNRKYFILAIEFDSNSSNNHYWYYYITKECYDVLDKYFIIREGKIICKYEDDFYNNITLTLYVGDKGQQTLHLMIDDDDDLTFTFYINQYKEFDLSRQHPYTFDYILIVNKNLILGNEGVDYYDISYYKDYILNNIDKDTISKINNAKDSEPLNIYTHIINRSKKCKLTIDNRMEAMRSNKHITKTPFSKGKHYNEFDITKLIPKREMNNKYTNDYDIKID